MAPSLVPYDMSGSKKGHGRPGRRQHRNPPHGRVTRANVARRPHLLGGNHTRTTVDEEQTVQWTSPPPTLERSDTIDENVPTPPTGAPEQMDSTTQLGDGRSLNNNDDAVDLGQQLQHDTLNLDQKVVEDDVRDDSLRKKLEETYWNDEGDQLGNKTRSSPNDADAEETIDSFQLALESIHHQLDDEISLKSTSDGDRHSPSLPSHTNTQTSTSVDTESPTATMKDHTLAADPVNTHDEQGTDSNSAINLLNETTDNGTTTEDRINKLFQDHANDLEATLDQLPLRDLDTIIEHESDRVQPTPADTEHQSDDSGASIDSLTPAQLKVASISYYAGGRRLDEATATLEQAVEDLDDAVGWWQSECDVACGVAQEHSILVSAI